MRELLLNSHRSLGETLLETYPFLLITGILLALAGATAFHARALQNATGTHRWIYSISAALGCTVFVFSSVLLVVVQIGFWDNCGNGCYPNLYFALLATMAVPIVVGTRVGYRICDPPNAE